MGISAVASYIGGALIDVSISMVPWSRDASRPPRHGPAGPRCAISLNASFDAGPRDGDPRAGRGSRAAPARSGFRPFPRRWRGASLLAADRRRDPGARRARDGRRCSGAAGDSSVGIDEALARYRTALARPTADHAVPRDELRVRPVAVATDLVDVEDAPSIVRRFVVSAMSVGALSPEAHQALTIGIQLAGGAANTGEGGEDPAWYVPGPDGRRRDAKIKQVASARFGVTATYLARADQLEIKIAQGSKPGEGGQLPGRKATAYIAALRRGQPGELHQPAAAPRHLLDRGPRPADRGPARDQPLGPDRGQARREPRSRDHRGRRRQGRRVVHPPVRARRWHGRLATVLDQARRAPWELGLAEVHQVLLRNDLRDRVALRTDGGLQTGRDLSSPPSSAPRSSRSGRRPWCRSAATWPGSAISTRARRGSRASARTSGRSSPARRPPCAVLHGHRRGPPPRAGGGRSPFCGRGGRREPPAAAGRAERAVGARTGHRRRVVGRGRRSSRRSSLGGVETSAARRHPRWKSGSPRRCAVRAPFRRPGFA